MEYVNAIIFAAVVILPAAFLTLRFYTLRAAVMKQRMEVGETSGLCLGVRKRLPYLKGEWKGVEIEARIYVRMGHRSGGHESLVRAWVGCLLPRGFCLSSAGVESVLAGDQDIQVGDPLLDDMLCIQAHQPQAAIDLLGNRAVRSAALRLFKRWPGAWLSDEKISIHQTRMMDGVAIRLALNDIAHFASALRTAMADDSEGD
jgi:hypothetical protein